MSAPSPVTAHFDVDISAASDPKHLLFFDRFGIYVSGNFYELHFGFSGRSRDIFDGLIVMIGKQVITELRQSFLAFVNQIGILPEMTELPECRLGPSCPVVFADLIGLARHLHVGEILMHSISWKVAVDVSRAKESKSIPTTCVALLRCELELQKRWIVGLYEATEN